jgi:hypothetical protein
MTAGKPLRSPFSRPFSSRGAIRYLVRRSRTAAKWALTVAASPRGRVGGFQHFAAYGRQPAQA